MYIYLRASRLKILYKNNKKQTNEKIKQQQQQQQQQQTPGYRIKQDIQ